MSLCHDCIKAKAVTTDKGTPVCQSCYHKRYSRKSHTPIIQRQPTIHDLKRKWEKNY